MLASILAADVLLDKEGILVAPTVLAAFLGTLVPLIVATLSQITASSKVKTTINLVLSVLTGVASYLLTVDGRATWLQLIVCVITAFGASNTTYSHLWKTYNVTAWLAVLTKYFGVGKDQALTTKIERYDLTDTQLKKAVSNPLGFKRAIAAVEDQAKLEELVKNPPVYLQGDVHVHGSSDIGGGPGRSPEGQHITGS